MRFVIKLKTSTPLFNDNRSYLVSRGLNVNIKGTTITGLAEDFDALIARPWIQSNDIGDYIGKKIADGDYDYL